MNFNYSLPITISLSARTEEITARLDTHTYRQYKAWE